MPYSFFFRLYGKYLDSYSFTPCIFVHQEAMNAIENAIVLVNVNRRKQVKIVHVLLNLFLTSLFCTRVKRRIYDQFGKSSGFLVRHFSPP